MGWLSRAFGGGRRAPRNVDSAMRSALLAVLARDFDEAERLLVAAVELDPRSVDPFIALARVFREKGEIGRAIRLHQNLLLRADLSPAQMVDALIDLAGDLEAGGFVQRAIASYEEALGHDAGRAEALRALLRLYEGEGRYDQALSASRKLSRLKGQGGPQRDSALRVGAAEAALSDGNLDQARRALKKALRVEPSSARAWIALGRVEAERGKPKAALAAWARVPQIDRAQGPEVYPRLAATYAALDRARDFEGYLRGLIQEAPEDPHAPLALARALAARGEAEEAVRVLRELMDHHPDDLEARAVLCRALLASGRDAELPAELGGLLEALERCGVLRDSEKLG